MSVTPPKYINKARIGDLKRRNEAREDAGEQPHSQSESQHRHVDGDFGQTRNIPGVENLEQLDRAYGQQQTRPCAEEPQHERFGQKLADQTTSPRPECRADGRLSPAGGGACQEKMGQIHGSDQQNEPHSRQQDPERSTELSARHPFTRGLDEKAHGFFPKLGVARLKAPKNGLQIETRGLDRDAGSETPNYHHAETRAIRIEVPHPRCENLRGIEPRTARRQNADDGVALAIQCDQRAHDSRLGGEFRSPKLVAQQQLPIRRAELALPR